MKKEEMKTIARAIKYELNKYDPDSEGNFALVKLIDRLDYIFQLENEKFDKDEFAKACLPENS